MFGYVKKSTHDAVVAERDGLKVTLKAVNAELDRTTSRLAQERENCRGADATARMYRDRCENLTAKLSAMEAAKRTGNGNLRQFRQPQVPTDVAGNPCA